MSAAAAPVPPAMPAPRDLRFDTVRGALLLIMAINHVGSDLSRVLDQPLGFVSAAEGFVFLSGVLSGRLDHVVADPGELRRRAGRRSVRAYACHAVCLLGVWLWVRGWMAMDLGRPWALPYLFHEGQGWTGLGSGLALLYQPGLLDILPMYVGFPWLVPLVLKWHARGRGLTIWLISGAVWALDQSISPAHPIVWGLVNTGAFHFLSWQWLFVTGVLLGAEPRWERRAIHEPRRWMLLAAGAGVLFLWAVRWSEVPDYWDLETLERLTQKTPLALLRLLNFGLLAYLLAVCGSWRPGWLSVRPLAMLGRHSLAVFMASIWCAQIALSFPDVADSAAGRWVRTGFTAASVMLIGLTCELHARYRRRQTVGARRRTGNGMAT